jgi:hypothetical protein
MQQQIYLVEDFEASCYWWQNQCCSEIQLVFCYCSSHRAVLVPEYDNRRSHATLSAMSKFQWYLVG